MTNRKYISKGDLLSNIFIPLPSIEEQDTLIKKYEAIIAEAEQCEKDVEQLEVSIDEYLFDILGVKPAYKQQNTSNLLFARYKNLNTRWELDSLTFAIQKSMENCLFPVRTIESKLSLVTCSWKNRNEQDSFNYIEIGG